MPVLGVFMSRSDSPGAVVSTTAGKFDAQVCDFAWYLNAAANTQGRSYTFTHPAAAGNVTWYHFAQISDIQGDGAAGFLHIIRDAGGREIVRFDLSSGNLRLTVTGSTTDNSSLIAVPITLTRFDVKIDFASGIAVDLYLDGGVSPTLSASVGSAGERGKPTTFVVQNNDSNAVYVSELYVADFDSRNTRPVKQVPNATGNYSAWSGGYAELGDEDLMTAADGASASDKVSVNLEAYPGPSSPAGISRVVVKIIGSKGATGPQDIAPFVRIGGTDYSASDLGVTETPLPYYAEWATNPDTAAEWTTANLDTTEIGLEAKA